MAFSLMPDAFPFDKIYPPVLTRVLLGQVLTGSTRMKAGTATKLALNTISTTLMVQAGRVYENLMVRHVRRCLITALVAFE
jgi:N-acetylmuramic acid 6-phosphate etherase